MDRQVEVIAGNHVLNRVAGAVILVAHRERGNPAPDSRALIAARQLGELVADAAEHAPDGPGRLVARAATRWLMRDAERIAPGESIEFGILSAADSGGVAIFLHGAVTAVLAGADVEYYCGSDAAFTVDRVAAPPDRAAGLFIDEGHRLPLPPQRGIGSLVEGVAPAAGAMVWFEGEPLPPRRPIRSARPRPIDPTPPTAAFDAEQDHSPRSESGEQIPLDPNLVPTRTSARLPAGLDAILLGDDTDTDETAVPATPFDLHHAPTEAGAVTDPGGTNPAPRPDPDLQRRLEATAKATALTVKLLGFKCARAHPSDPRSAFCTVCGMPVDQTQPVTEVVRPPLGMLVLDDGMTFMVTTDAVMGRDPEYSEAARNGLVPLRIDDNSGGMSRAHAEIRLVNWDITVVDRGSTNGTRVRLPGYRDWVRLQPHQPITLAVGAELMLGNRVLRLDPVAPPPFG